MFVAAVRPTLRTYTQSLTYAPAEQQARSVGGSNAGQKQEFLSYVSYSTYNCSQYVVAD